MCAWGMQRLNYRLSQRVLAELCRLGCVWGCEAWKGRSCHACLYAVCCSTSFSWHNVLLLLALCRAIMETCRDAKLTVINKLKIYLILLLWSTDGPLLRNMHVFRTMQNIDKVCKRNILCVYMLLMFHLSLRTLMRTFLSVGQCSYIPTILFCCFILKIFCKSGKPFGDKL